jgi:hypothetical protein
VASSVSASWLNVVNNAVYPASTAASAKPLERPPLAAVDLAFQRLAEKGLIAQLLLAGSVQKPRQVLRQLRQP